MGSMLQFYYWPYLSCANPIYLRRWGVTFELIEVAVVDIRVSFASIRHERYWGALGIFRKRENERSLMYRWKGRQEHTGMDELKKLVGELSGELFDG